MGAAAPRWARTILRARSEPAWPYGLGSVCRSWARQNRVKASSSRCASVVSAGEFVHRERSEPAPVPCSGEKDALSRVDEVVGDRTGWRSAPGALAGADAVGAGGGGVAEVLDGVAGRVHQRAVGVGEGAGTAKGALEVGGHVLAAGPGRSDGLAGEADVVEDRGRVRVQRVQGPCV
jgi:hypothetical protein